MPIFNFEPVNIETPTDITVVIRDPSEIIYNAEMSQVSGVGGENPPDYQVQTAFQYPPSLTTGVFISRFKSNYNGTDGKTEIALGGIGQWSLHDTLEELDGAGIMTRLSRENLSAGTGYVGLHWWIRDDYYNSVFVDQTQTIEDAINADAVWPTGNDVVVTNEVTISAIVTAASDIGGSFNAVTGAAEGTPLGTATVNRTNGTFSQGTPALDWVEVSENGRLAVAAGETAPATGDYAIELVYDNSAAGGGVYAEILNISVRDATGATDKFIPIPPVNANGGVYFASISALKSALDNLNTNWNGTMASWGLASTGVEPVLGLAAGQHGDITWSNLGPFPQRVTIRGQGPFSRDSYTPTAGTKVGRVRWNNIDNLRMMGFEAEPSSISTVYNQSNHRVENCNRIEWVRNAIFGDVARTQSALATTPKAGTQVLIWLDETDDSKFIQNVLMGSRECVIGKSPNLRADRIEFRGNVDAQNHNDFIKWGDSVCDDWIVADNLAFGKGRNSGAQHRDFIQVLGTNATGYARRWLIEGNWMQSRTAWGSDTYLAKQFAYWGGGSANSEATILDNLVGSPGKGVQSWHGGATVKFNSFFIPIDTLGAQSSNGRWTANFSGIRAATTLDENIVFSYTGSPTGAGPNGIGVQNSGFIGADNESAFGVTWNWDQMGQFLENYDDTYSSIASITSDVSPNEEGGLDQYKPKVGTRAHWDHADPTGCYQLFRRVFDEVDHDHWKDWGWPTAPACHLHYDLNNAAGGASGTYETFDGDGTYLG